MRPTRRSACAAKSSDATVVAALAAIAALTASTCALAADPPAPSMKTFAERAAAAPTTAPTMADVLKASTPSDWRALDPDRTLYMDLPSGRVVIELAAEFAPKHVANLRTLVAQKFFDGLAIVRVQDNYVTQWGDPDGTRSLGAAATKLPPEYERPSAGLPFTKLPDGDVYAPEVGWSGGFPVARDPAEGKAWLTHCYAMVGVGRDLAPDSGNAAELYVVIGHAPRHLDRNITTIGRVVQGMEKLTALPRGTEALGFYKTAAERTPIRSVRFASEVPAAERVDLEVLRTDTPTFTALVETRRNRRDAFFTRPAGHVDLCNVPIPVRVRTNASGVAGGGAGAATLVAAGSPAADAATVATPKAPSLSGTKWQWALTLDPERTWSPADPARYTLQLFDGGDVDVRADCNRGRGRLTNGPGFVSSDDSAFLLGPLATTKMLCPDSRGLDTRFLTQLGGIRSVALVAGLLRADLLADSGTMFFVAEADPKVASYRCDQGRTADAIYTAGRARVLAGPHVLDLKQVPSASGAKYASGDATWFTKGPDGWLEKGGRRIVTGCRTTTPAI